MKKNEELVDIRRRIDIVDDQIVPLLAQRIELALKASRYKHTAEEVRGCDRVAYVLDAVAVRAHDADGDVKTIRAIYECIIRELTNMQLREKGMPES